MKRKNQLFSQLAEAISNHIMKNMIGQEISAFVLALTCKIAADESFEVILIDHIDQLIRVSSVGSEFERGTLNPILCDIKNYYEGSDEVSDIEETLEQVQHLFNY